jgi:hypothetical protein
MLPDRIDFIQTPQGTAVRRYIRHPFRDRMYKHDTKPPNFDLDAALDWCTQNGYTVRKWNGGARAWKGAPWPIRTAWQIMRKRHDIEQIALAKMKANPGKWHTEESILQLDLAYDG